MRQRAQAAYEKGGIDATAEISTLTERLTGRDLQITEARQQAEAAAETIIRLEAELRAAAGEAIMRLQNTAASDREQRQSLFGQVMEPLKSSLDRVDSRIGELERDRAAAYAAMRQQVESMMRTQGSLQGETAHLASALRTPASRGRWGEVQLRRVVELAGMIPHCDFIEPSAAVGRPDLIVQLPKRQDYRRGFRSVAGGLSRLRRHR